MVDVGGTPMIQTGGSGDSMGSSWIWAFLLFSLLNRGGIGGLGGGEGVGLGLEKSLFNSHSFNQLDNGIRSLQSGLCDSSFSIINAVKDSAYATSREVDRVNQNTGNAICNQTYEVVNQIRNVGDKVANCCCTVERAIDAVRYDGEKHKNDIIQATERSNQNILNWLNNKEIADKNQRIFEFSQREQTREIIAAQKPVAPVPAYLQPSPYAPYYPYGFNGGFGAPNTGCSGF